MVEDEHSTARLLRLAGPRSAAPAERATRVHQGVRGEWRAHTRRRATRRRLAGAALLLAGAAAVAFALTLIRGADMAPQALEIVARVERIEGETSLAAGAIVRAGDWVQTGGSARAALRLANGTSVRFDESSRARLVSGAQIELTGGALYIDTGREKTALEIRTPLGTARDIGTQFEVRLHAETLRVRVRAGIVELRRGGDPVAVRAGTELAVTAREVVTRPIPGHGSDWAWAAALAPRFDIEGRTVAAFVEHLSREHGWSLRYADAALARDASSIILHGSVAGLEPEDALAAALMTSDLAHRVRDGELLVLRRSEREQP